MRIFWITPVLLAGCLSLEENVAPPGPLEIGQTLKIAIEGDGALVTFPLVACSKPSGMCVDWPQFGSPEVAQTDSGYRVEVGDEVAIYRLAPDGTGTLEAPESVTPLVWFR